MIIVPNLIYVKCIGLKKYLGNIRVELIYKIFAGTTMAKKLPPMILIMR